MIPPPDAVPQKRHDASRDGLNELLHQVVGMRAVYLMGVLTVLFTAQVRLQMFIDQRRSIEGLSSRYLFQPAEVVNNILAGGFRGLAVDLLWVRVDDYSHRGQWYKLLPLFRMVTFLQPKFITAWSVGGWHMAFNLYFQGRTLDEKKKWLDAGLRFLKEGIQNNPGRYELYFETGWTYYFKVKGYPNAIRYLSRAVHFPHPQFVDHVLAHSYERDGQLVKALVIWKELQTRENRSKSLEGVVNRTVRRIEEELERSR